MIDRVIVLLVCLNLLLLTGTQASSAPSRQLQATLDSRFEAVPTNLFSLTDIARFVLQSLHDQGNNQLPIIGIEYLQGEPEPQVHTRIPSGTLREQLDNLCGTIGYAWLADGDRICLVPSSMLQNSSYPFNIRIDGRVAVSLSSAKATPMQKWFADHKISTASDIHSTRLTAVDGVPVPYKPEKPLCADPTVLENPTVRQVWCVNAALNGNNIWIGTVRIIPDTKGAERLKTCILGSGAPFRPTEKPDDHK